MSNTEQLSLKNKNNWQSIYSVTDPKSQVNFLRQEFSLPLCFSSTYSDFLAHYGHRTVSYPWSAFLDFKN